ncbi:MAG: MetQ/NlpA family ABC transporter substrate-binding protein [Endozoicomonas sp.]
MNAVRKTKAVSQLKALLGSALVATSVMLVGCGDTTVDDALRVGVIAGPEADVMQVAADIAEKEHGVTVKLIEFSDYVAPNTALSEGSIDVNAFQHRPYLDSMVRDRGFELTVVGNTFVYPIGAYSNKIKDMKELQEGARVAIPNDPSNEGRTLILLDQSGYIKLRDINNLEATPADIVENPMNLRFIELDAAQLPRSLDDVDLAFINSTYAVPAGLLPTRDALLVEGRDSPYVNIIVSREDNKTDERILKLVESYQTEAVEAKAEELFKGSAVAGWK